MNNFNPNIKDLKIKTAEPLSKYTFTKTGGKADYLALPANQEQLSQLLTLANADGLPITILGNASNLIVSDKGIRGLTVILSNMTHITINGNRIIADAGAALIDVAIAAQQHGLSGLEFAAGIPGSVGGAIYMNAGAYGGQTADVVNSATVVDFDGEVKTLTNAELDFDYRHSIIQNGYDAVVSVEFELMPGNQKQILAKMDHFNALRSSKQPLELPSCGSVFKRPKNHFAGKLIHDAGLQGYRFGGAEVSTKHAGFIVNVGGATATDYLNVIHHVQEVVFHDSGIKLETEVRIIGDK
ncbi:UDP-N-acetylmuramate dehydrogenase [Nicoliella spurrieriana]|uniref:UDP-N-acetylenolpyruvoylglucosamine reductase n=1 Tax=Nicoliella spurrieriana TaxID=2925830 RepID=A0A976X5V4_9LACO|nr:UDP-N-acetylmuramate dehydrogenase [Nicoliella spurrieriana]UQS86957.1 UDP-N-acetylmuramate dehydrogenase [Nicoliella spurrieriana]